MNVPDSPPAPQPTLLELFLVCFKIGLTSFGGGLAGWFYREFVEIRGWMSDEEFASTLAVSQMLPGANVTNFLISLGQQLRGVAGALACVFGLIVGPFFLLIAFSVGLDRISNVAQLERITGGVAFAALGLLIIVCLKGVQRALPRPEMVALIFATAFGVGIMQWPLLLVALALSPVGVFLAWRRIR